MGGGLAPPIKKMVCLSPVLMYDTGRFTPNGKRLLSAKYSEFYINRSPIPVPCGKCSACLETRRREWVKRLVLESTLYPFSSFVTLTYNDKSLPIDFCASKSDIQKFLKRLRNAGRDFSFSLPRFRYFIVSEYGKKFHRPHYHGIFFGLDFYEPVWRPRLVSVDKYPRITSDVLESIWSHGFVLFDRATSSNISYVSKYITKSSKDVWSLKSIGLGRDLFVGSNGFTSLGLSTVHYGSVVVPSRSSFSKVRAPKFLDRYIERFLPDEFSRIKDARRSYLSKKLPDELSRVRSFLNLQSERESKERKLDNES